MKSNKSFNLFQTIRKRKYIAVTMAMLMVNQCIFPGAAYAVSGGWDQPEGKGFMPAGDSQLVDLFSGKFMYNVDLMDVGGYPIGLSYSGDASMDQPASSVGLNWDLSIGGINKTVRGIPDEFMGDTITKTTHLKPDITVMLKPALDGELFGAKFSKAIKKLKGKIPGLNENSNIGKYDITPTWNSYTGLSFTHGYNSPEAVLGKNGSITAGMNLTSGAGQGISIDPSLSISGLSKNEKKYNLGLSGSFNSLAGLRAINIGGTYEGKKLLSRYGNGSISFADRTHLPYITSPMKSFTATFDYKPGGSVFGVDGIAEIKGRVSVTSVQKKVLEQRAYGYPFTEKASKKDLKDFNREKDALFNYKKTTNLPLTNHTYDAIQVTGQGISGTYRAYRSQVDVLNDPQTRTISIDPGLAFETEVGALLGIGGDIHINGRNQKAGGWTMNNKAAQGLAVTSPDDLYEHTYYKQTGEEVVDTDDMLDKIGGEHAARIPIKIFGPFGTKTEEKFEVRKVDSLDTKWSSVLPFYNEMYRGERYKRKQHYSQISVATAEKYALQPNLILDSLPEEARPHHVGEVTITRMDQARYVFGLPKYNTYQKEVEFNMSTTDYVNAQANASTGLIPYNPGVDNSVENKKGIDHYYSSTETPGYATGHLLTAVLSPDYEDVGQDGITLDDYGTATEFKYHSIRDFKWRVPYEKNQANYYGGLYNVKGDDRASYIYGEKDVWYPDTIRNKTHIAIFEYSNRKDGYPVLGENGGIDTLSSPMQKVDKITLYARPELEENGSDATPIQVVEFRYDYSLCQGVPCNSGSSELTSTETANQGGKLTLLKVIINGENSERGKRTPYEFTYMDNNPDYNLKAYDRWGNYKPNNSGSTYDYANKSNGDNPYSSQVKSNLDTLVAAWNIKSIIMPSHGKIEVDYEAADYAYVQDKRAMQMIQIKGFGDALGDASSPDSTFFSGSTLNDYIFFELPDTVGTVKQLKKKYFDDMEYLGFKCMVNFNRTTNEFRRKKEGENYDFVNGYLRMKGESSDIEDYGVTSSCGTNCYKYGWIKVKEVSIRDDDASGGEQIHPIQKAALEFARMSLPRKLTAQSDPPALADNASQKIGDVVKSFADQNIFTELVKSLQHPSGRLKDWGMAKQIYTKKSWVRVYAPTYKKLAGQSRVKEVRMYDSWDEMTNSNETLEYTGQTYTYTTEIKGEEGTRTEISSGVAAYEPLVGGEENPMRQPIYLNEGNRLKKGFTFSTEQYIEHPLGESFYPGASIGYSKVTVKNIERTNVKRHATGKTVDEFYTSKDFPVKVLQMDLKAIPTGTKPLNSVLSNVSEKVSGIKIDNMTTSQGYYVELPQMHGKPKAQWVFAEGQTDYISGVEYKYKTKNNGDRLDNETQVIGKDGKLRNATLGVEYDACVDSREFKTESVNGELRVDFNLLVGFPVPYPSFNVNGSAGVAKTQYRSIVTTKVAKKYGVIDEVIAHDLGAVVSTKNIAYDEETGEPLLTETINNYSDNIYNLNYPAHWGYDRMGLAYQNQGATHKSVVTSGTFPVSNADTKFVDGDEVIIAGNDSKYWVEDVSTSTVTLIDNLGNNYAPANGTYFLTVLRSGRSNQANLSIGSLTTKENPLPSVGSTIDIDTSNHIIMASVVELDEEWGGYCSNLNTSEECTDGYNSLADELMRFSNDLFDTLEARDNGSISYFAENNYNSYPNILSKYWITEAIYDSLRQEDEECPDSNKVLHDIDGYEDLVEARVPNTNAFVCGDGVNAATTSCDCDNSGDTTLIFKASFWNTWQTCEEAEGTTETEQTCQLSYEIIPDFHEDFSGYNWEDRQNVFETVEITGVRVEDFGGTDFIVFDATVTFKGDMSASNVEIRLVCSCIDAVSIECPQVDCDYDCPKASDTITNPFLLGKKGQFRQKTSYLYLSDIVQDFDAPKLRTDGYYENFDEFWQPNAGNDWTKSTTNWKWAEEVTKYSPYGMELENQDAAYRYASTLYGYGEKFPVAVTSNSRYSDMGYDGFEDYEFRTLDDCKNSNRHFGVTSCEAKLTDVIAHTGRYSMALTNGQSATIEKPLTSVASSDNCVGEFSPSTYLASYEDQSQTTKKYVLNYWVKEIDFSGSEPPITYVTSAATITAGGSTITPTSTRKSRIIEDWQQIEIVFEIPVNTTGNISIKFENLGGAGLVPSCFLDDIRIHPFKASMVSYVIDPVNYKLIAELDVNNYATFYEYNERGEMVRTKKETERGIMTIQENRAHLFEDAAGCQECQ